MKSVLPQSLSWREETPQRIKVGAGGPGLSDGPSLTITNPHNRPYRLVSHETFAVPDTGLVVFLHARTEQNVQLGLYRREESQGAEMLLIVAKPVKIAGKNDRLWYLETYLQPVAPGQEFGIYLAGPNTMGTHHFAEMQGFFYAY